MSRSDASLISARGRGPRPLSLHGPARLSRAPALVISQGAVGQDVVLAGISSVVRGALAPTDLTVATTHAEFPLTGLRVTSVIRSHKVAAVELGVVIRRLGRIGPQLQAEVNRLLRLVLGL